MAKITSKSYEDALVHDGVEGMKKGRRRWQYVDGRWTPEGLARRRAQYEQAKKNLAADDEWFREDTRIASDRNLSDADRAKLNSRVKQHETWRKNAEEDLKRQYADVEDYKKTYDSTVDTMKTSSKQILSEAKELNNVVDSVKSRKAMAKYKQSLQNHTKSLSDEELAKRTRRLSLENQYMREVSAQAIDKGKITASDILNGVEAVGNLAITALGIVESVGKLTKKFDD